MSIKWTIEHRTSVSSTSDVARSLIVADASEGAVVVADVQTAGRGSRGRKWFSPPGANLLASVILYPELPFAKTVELSFVAAVAVAETLRKIGLDARIKWPNDVLVNGKKICGILIETVPRVGEHPAAIVGIGINVNWKEMDPEIAQTATSVFLELGREESVGQILGTLLEEFERYYETFKQSGLGSILVRWRELGWTVGRIVNVSVENRTVRGKAVGVDDSGSLLVETDDGVVTVTAAGTLLPEDSEGRLE